MKHTINITGSTIGAMAVGSDATAQGEIPSGPVANGFTLKIEARGALRSELAAWLHGVASRVEHGGKPTDTYASTRLGASFAMTLHPTGDSLGQWGPQYEWEPPRTVGRRYTKEERKALTKEEREVIRRLNRAPRLKAAGNAVVPLCGFVAGVALRDLANLGSVPEP